MSDFSHTEGGDEVPPQPEPGPVLLPADYRIDRIEFRVVVGRWRGRLKLSESDGAGLMLLLPEDDAQPEPYGRALEKFLAELIERARASGGEA